MKKHLLLLLAISIICSYNLYSCSSTNSDTSQTNHISESETIKFTKIATDYTCVSTGVSFPDIMGDKETFESLTKEEKDFLAQYLIAWRESIILLQEHKSTPDNHKTQDMLTNDEHINKLLEEYVSTDKTKAKVILDFYNLTYVDAKYMLNVLEFKSNLNHDSVYEMYYIKDDKYAQYVYDLAKIYNKLSQTYFPEPYVITKP